MAAYAIQAFSSNQAETGSYGGRFFAICKSERANAYVNEWGQRRNTDLSQFWPKTSVPEGFKTTYQRIPEHGYPLFADMFNPVQLLGHAQLLRAITTTSPGKHSDDVREFVLGCLQQYLRNQNMFCLWNIQADKLEPHFSNNNYYPKNTPVENSFFGNLGRGNWRSCSEGLIESLAWAKNPWELVSLESLSQYGITTEQSTSRRSEKVETKDPIGRANILCSSGSELSDIKDCSIDLVITDPPFGNNVQYAELADFFHVWLRIPLSSKYTEMECELSPKALEAVVNPVRNLVEPEAFYQKILTDVWKECGRILKTSGILAFTFHHSEDEPWVRVLVSLFNAGFYLEATYPIRSDETKGEGAKPGTFGSQLIEYDIIHVCRKRVTDPQPISWARLRRLIMDDVHSIKNLLSQHQTAGLPAADLQVIKRGKALEYFSRHYGKVYVEQGREFTIREALVGINQLLNDDTGTTGGPEAPPANAEPYTRQFFRLFYETTQVPRDQMQKFLRGTGIAPSDFEERSWCSESKKVFTLTPPVELARAWKGASRKGMARDFDQTMFLVGGCIEGSNIRVTDTLDSPNFAPHPATVELVDWLTKHGGSQEIRFAARRARTIYRDWMAKNKGKVEEQLKLFDLGA